MALKRTIVIESLKISSPTTIDCNFLYFFSETASSEATVSMLHMQADSSRTYQIDNVLILVISLISLIRSIYFEGYLIDWLLEQGQR